METLDQKIDAMSEELKQQELKQAHDKWRARVDDLQQRRAEERPPEGVEE